MAPHYTRGDILDLGCGSSDIPRYLDVCGRYVGIDKNSDLVRGLRSRVDIPDAVFYVRDLDHSDLNVDGYFDTVLIADQLHKSLAALGLTHKDAVQQHHHLYNGREMLELFRLHGYSPVLLKRFELGLNQLFICRKQQDSIGLDPYPRGNGCIRNSLEQRGDKTANTPGSRRRFSWLFAFSFFLLHEIIARNCRA